MGNEPEPTPIEQLAAWSIHRTAAAEVLKNSGHYDCAQAIGFRAAARPGEVLATSLGKACERCQRIWDNSKGKEGKDL